MPLAKRRRGCERTVETWRGSVHSPDLALTLYNVIYYNICDRYRFFSTYRVKGVSVMDDKRIIAMFWERDEYALTAVREKYGKLCRHIAYNLLGNTEDTEECENDAYLAVWNAIPPARPQSLRAYLGRIVRNIAMDRFDRRTAKKRGGEMSELLPELCEVVGGTVEEAFDSVHTAELITVFLHEEEEEYRRLFLRRYWYGDSLAALARGLGCGESAVKMRLARQRERLRRFLEERGVSV